MTTSDRPIVTTVEGPVKGIVENDVFVFKGIPYAKPPVGDLRWRKPEDVEPWEEVREADKYGSACIQNRELCTDVGGGDPCDVGGGEIRPLSEDCLYLNVWTPKDAPNSDVRLPVMVWIHGGAYLFGAGGLPPYIGSPLVNRGAVVVTINYRLGHLGFFAHPALDSDDPDGLFNNFGLLDQIAALKWVQRNIERFGGDPGNVTIFGQSAGGKSVLALFASKLAEGLFHKGIAQSVYGLPEAKREQALERGKAFASANGLSADATAEELRALPAEDFWKLPPETSNAPTPIWEDEVLRSTILDTFKAGNQAKVPLIIGSNSDDASVVKDFGVNPVEIVEKLRAGGFSFPLFYPGIKGDKELGRQVCRDLVFTVLVRRIAENHRKVAPVYRYYFDYPAVELRPCFRNGTRHADEIIYPFGTGDLCPPTQGFFTDADRAFSSRVSEYWFEFARTGTPASSESPEWLPHAVEKVSGLDKLMDRTLKLGTPITLEKDFHLLRLTALVGVLNLIGEEGDD